MPEPRRYLAVIQDPHGYNPEPGGDPAPPEGPHEPQIWTVVKLDDHAAVAAECDRLREVLRALDDALATHDVPEQPTVGQMRRILANALNQTQEPT